MLTRAELRHIVWQQLGIRVAPEVTVQQMEDLLHYRVMPQDLPANPINKKRDQIIAFIRDNRDRLSLPCSGDCYQHTDAMVLNCHSMVRGIDAAKIKGTEGSETAQARETVQEGADSSGQGGGTAHRGSGDGVVAK